MYRFWYQSFGGLSRLWFRSLVLQILTFQNLRFKRNAGRVKVEHLDTRVFLYYYLVMQLSSNTQTSLNLTFAALADPTRRAILAQLMTGKASVNELVKPFSLSQPAISKHLRVLEQAGLISRSRDAQKRPCKIEVQPLLEANQWLEDYRRLWEANYQRLEDLLEELQTTGKPALKKGKKGKS